MENKDNNVLGEEMVNETLNMLNELDTEDINVNVNNSSDSDKGFDESEDYTSRRLEVGKKYILAEDLKSTRDEGFVIPKDAEVKIYAEFKDGGFRVINQNNHITKAINVYEDFDKFIDNGYMEGYEPEETDEELEDSAQVQGG